MTELPEGRKPITTMDSADLVLRMHKKLAAGFTAGDRIAALEELVDACKADAREAEAYAAELEAKLAKAVEALTPSGETKAAYIAEVETDCPSGQAHTVSWTATKEIMKMIRHFAELKGQADD